MKAKREVRAPGKKVGARNEITEKFYNLSTGIQIEVCEYFAVRRERKFSAGDLECAKLLYGSSVL